MHALLSLCAMITIAIIYNKVVNPEIRSIASVFATMLEDEAPSD